MEMIAGFAGACIQGKVVTPSDSHADLERIKYMTPGNICQQRKCIYHSLCGEELTSDTSTILSIRTSRPQDAMRPPSASRRAIDCECLLQLLWCLYATVIFLQIESVEEGRWLGQSCTGPQLAGLFHSDWLSANSFLLAREPMKCTFVVWLCCDIWSVHKSLLLGLCI